MTDRELIEALTKRVGSLESALLDLAIAVTEWEGGANEGVVYAVYRWKEKVSSAVVDIEKAQQGSGGFN